MISQGDVWWADLADPVGSAPGYRRPIIVVQGDAFNHSRVGTIVSVPLTRSLEWAPAPGNVMLRASATGLEYDSVAQALHVVALSRTQLFDHVGRIDRRLVERIIAGINIVLGH